MTRKDITSKRRRVKELWKENEFETYKKAKSGEKVLLFEIGTRMVYAVHPL